MRKLSFGHVKWLLPWYPAKVWRINMQLISRNILLEQCLSFSLLPFYNQLHSSLPGTTSSAIELMDFCPLYLVNLTRSSLLQWVPNRWCGQQDSEWVCFCLSLQFRPTAPSLVFGLVTFTLFILDPDKNSSLIPLIIPIFHIWAQYCPHATFFFFFLTYLGSQKYLFNERGSGVSIKKMLNEWIHSWVNIWRELKLMLFP